MTVDHLLDEPDESDEALDDILLLVEIQKVSNFVWSEESKSIFQLTMIEDEIQLMEKLSALFHQVRASSTIFRPYQQHFVTTEYVLLYVDWNLEYYFHHYSGCNRVTWSNFRSKYPVAIFQKLFRFKQEHVVVLLSALEVFVFVLSKPAQLILDLKIFLDTRLNIF